MIRPGSWVEITGGRHKGKRGRVRSKGVNWNKIPGWWVEFYVPKSGRYPRRHLVDSVLVLPNEIQELVAV